MVKVEKYETFLECFLARISKIKLNFELIDRFKSKRLVKAFFKIFLDEELLFYS